MMNNTGDSLALFPFSWHFAFHFSKGKIQSEKMINKGHIMYITLF